jgi:plasmid stabilization system protein ParE
VARVIWTDPALADLETIAEYIARDSLRQASLLVQRAFLSTDRLDAFPQLGRIVPEIGDESVRELIVRPYRIVHVLRGSDDLVVYHSTRPLGAADLPDII